MAEKDTNVNCQEKQNTYVNDKLQQMREMLNAKAKDKYGKCYLAEKMWETLNEKTKNSGNDKCQGKM